MLNTEKAKRKEAVAALEIKITELQDMQANHDRSIQDMQANHYRSIQDMQANHDRAIQDMQRQINSASSALDEIRAVLAPLQEQHERQRQIEDLRRSCPANRTHSVMTYTRTRILQQHF